MELDGLFLSFGPRIVILMQVNLNTNRIQLPPAATPPYLLASIETPPTLLLYAPSPPPAKPEEPKKKFAFKAGPPAVTSQSVHLFHLQEQSWTSLQTKGKFPSRRANTSCTCLGSCLMLYGGRQVQPQKLLNDLYCLNLQTWQWKKLFTMQAPKAQQKVVLCSFRDQLVLLGQELWLFNAKGVNWQAESADLPGGVWQRINLEISIRPLCGYIQQDRLVVFGQRGQSIQVQALSIDLDNEPTATPLLLSRQIQSNNRSLSICSTSEGKGMIVDQAILYPFSISNSLDTIAIGEESQCEIKVEQFVAHAKINYGIQGKDIVELEVEVEREEEQLPNTARQIIREETYHNHSIQEREPYEESSSRPLPSPLSEGLTAPILTRLSPLLAREWLRRRILQQKSKLLESTIKKAEKMVLALCRYGEQEQKQVHIAKVCKLREQLCKVLQSETFIRREMEERPGQKELRAQAVKEEHGVEGSQI